MLTLAQAINLFLGEYQSVTRRTYAYSLHPMMNFIGPDRPLESITAAHLLEYMQAYAARPTVTSPATINKHIKTIRTFFNWCIRAGFIQPPNPAHALKRRRQQKAVSREKAMPEALYQRLLEYAQWDPRYHALVLFLGDTGCRIGGALLVGPDCRRNHCCL